MYHLMFKSIIIEYYLWIKQNFIFVKIVERNFHQLKLGFIVKYVNQI